MGSGAVKITPAHDFNDFEVGKRHNLELLNILNDDSTLNDKCPEEYAGLDRFEARKLIVKNLKDQGYIEKIEDYKTTIPYGDRSNTIVEPYLTNQWFCNAEELAKQAMKVVKRGKLNFFPRTGKDIFSVDGKYSTLVYISSNMVGAPNSSLVWTRWKRILCRNRRRG